MPVTHLTKPLPDCTIFLLAKAYQKAHGRFKEMLKPYGLTNLQHLVLEGLWYESGQTQREENWRNGKQEGPTTLWYANGQKAGHLFFEGGKRQGTHNMWHENGQKSFEMNYKDGHFHGLFTEWYANGNKKEQVNYTKNKKDGTETRCDETGQVLSQKRWRNGVLVE